MYVNCIVQVLNPGAGNGNPLQYSCLGSPMGRGAWRARVHGVAKSWTWLSDSAQICHSFSSKDQVSFNFMAAVTICSDFGAQENAVCHYFHCLSICYEVMEWDAMIFDFVIGIVDHLICPLRNLYASQEATMRTEHGTTDWFRIRKGVCQSCILSPWLLNLYAEYIMKNAQLDEAQTGIIHVAFSDWSFSLSNRHLNFLCFFLCLDSSFPFSAE